MRNTALTVDDTECLEVRTLLPARPRIDRERLMRAVRETLCSLGEDPDREGLADTPRRVARAFEEMLGGAQEDAATHLSRVFGHTAKGEDLVIVRNIEFSSLCEHHLLSFSGRVHVAYLPHRQRVVGLSKVARTVDVFARRLQLQERMTDQIAQALIDEAGARGVAVVVEAEHSCMRIRGAAKRQADMVTTAFRGLFERSESLRNQALLMFQSRGFGG